MIVKLKPSVIAISAILATGQTLAEELKPIVVEGEFRPAQIEEVAASVSVVDDVEISKRHAQHVENVLNMTPNVNFSAGASRGQYFQIRGIGERSQFETPINPSVGLNIDGVDYSRTGAAASLFDASQVEVLRGPQGTRFGANAMAGMILITSNEPTEEPEAYVEQTVANRNTYTTGAVLSGPIQDEKLLGRLAIQKHVSDGYMENTFLDKEDTNNQDELTGKAQLKWLASKDLTVDFTVMHFDKDNGYDAFTLDNDYTTESDTPGKDTLESTAYAVKTAWNINPEVTMEAVLSKSDSDIEYSYDADWVYLDKFDAGLWPYNGFDQYLRTRNNRTIDLRWLSSEQGRIFNNTTDWVFGLYQNSQSEKTTRNYMDFDWDAVYVTDIDFDTKNQAAYTQFDYHANDKLTYTFGVRAEKYESDYADSNGIENDYSETLFGGKLGLTYAINAAHTSYGQLSKGYKTGGINNDSDLPEALRNFGTEYLWNLETGLKSKWLNNDLQTRIALFYSKRVNPQISSSYQVSPSDFAIFKSNVDEGYNYGLEAEMNWTATDQLQINANLGLLKTGLNEHEYTDKYSGITYIMEEGRDQAHAPSYQFALGAEYYVDANWTMAASIEGKDAFYFSDNHNEESAAYSLVNASAEYNDKHWTVTLWARNLFDKEYDVRGFHFGNDPSLGYLPQTYTQKGERRTVGLTARYDF